MSIEEVHASDARNLRVVVVDVIYPHALIPVPYTAKTQRKEFSENCVSDGYLLSCESIRFFRL